MNSLTWLLFGVLALAAQQQVAGQAPLLQLPGSPLDELPPATRAAEPAAPVPGALDSETAESEREELEALELDEAVESSAEKKAAKQMPLADRIPYRNPPVPVVMPYWGEEANPPPTLYYFGSDRNFGSPILTNVWVGAEYLGWALKSADLPPIVTTSPLGTPPEQAGVLGQGASVLFGDTQVHDGLRSGGRLRGGFWLSHARVHGFEGSYLGVDGNDVEFFASGDGDTILARPYLNAVTGQSASLLTAYPDLQDGQIYVQANLEFTSAEALYRHVFHREPFRQYDLLLGYRYGRLYDQFRTDELIVSQDDDSGFPTDALVSRADLFQAISQFHGGQAGLQARWALPHRFALSVLGKAALGATTTRFHVDGETLVLEPEVDATTGTTSYVLTETHEGGLLAQPTNSGTYSSNDLAWLSELGISLEYVWNAHVRLSLGYTLIYWTDVARVLDHVDTTVNPSQLQSGTLDGPGRPEFRLSLEEFWAQGINVGIEIDF